MKISETINRECCEAKDLLPYHGVYPVLGPHLEPKFCKHCGQIWILARKAGEMEDNYHRLDGTLIPIQADVVIIPETVTTATRSGPNVTSTPIRPEVQSKITATIRRFFEENPELDPYSASSKSSPEFWDHHRDKYARGRDLWTMPAKIENGGFGSECVFTATLLSENGQPFLHSGACHVAHAADIDGQVLSDKPPLSLPMKYSVDGRVLFRICRRIDDSIVLIELPDGKTGLIDIRTTDVRVA